MKDRWSSASLHGFFSCIKGSGEHLELKGKLVVIGADPKGGSGRGLRVSEPTNARKYGVHSSMPVIKDFKLCPNHIFLLSRVELYKAV